MDFDDIYTEGTQTKYLDEILALANEKHNAPVAVVKGLPGFGKTAVTKSWLKHYNLKHVYLNTTLLDEETLFDDSTKDEIISGESIVVFDDYAFAKDSIRKDVLNLIAYGNMKCGEGVYLTNVYPRMYIIIITLEPSRIEKFTDEEIKLFGLEKYKKK